MKVTVESTTAFPEPESGVGCEAERDGETVRVALLIASSVPSEPRDALDPPDPPKPPLVVPE